MKRQFVIKSWSDGNLLVEVEANTLRAALEIAVGRLADLRGADLRGANLYGANLYEADLHEADLHGADLREAELREADLHEADLHGADLRGADLRGAELREVGLRGADLRGANLYEANLYEADLRGADLRGADLREADLREADLRGADLHGANLRGADLREAGLRGADLRGAMGLKPEWVTPLLLLREQPGLIRAYKLVTADGVGPYNGGLRYPIGETVAMADADADPTVPCGPGINLATLDWCLAHWEPGFRVLIAEFTAGDIAAIPTATDGKFRVRRCTIIGEKDLTGLVPMPAEARLSA